MKRIFWLSFILAGCSSLVRTPSPVSRLSIVFQSNRYGNLETCDCHTNPFGGIDRELNALTEIRKTNAAVLNVDAGNIFVPNKPSGSIDYYRSRAKLVAPLLDDLGLDVVAPGPSDFTLGANTLNAIQKASAFRFISSNVTQKNGDSVFPKWLRINKAGISIAVMALTPPFDSQEWIVEDPATALRSLLSTVVKTEQLVIVLSQLGNRLDEQLAGEFPSIHIIVGADPVLATDRPQWHHGHTLVVDPDINGYLLGHLSLDIQLPITGLYCPHDVTANQALVKQYHDRVTKNEDLKYKEYLAALIKTSQLTIPENASRYHFELIRLDEARFGRPNHVTPKIAAVKEALRQSTVSEAK